MVISMHNILENGKPSFLPAIMMQWLTIPISIMKIIFFFLLLSPVSYLIRNPLHLTNHLIFEQIFKISFLHLHTNSLQ